MREGFDMRVFTPAQMAVLTGEAAPAGASSYVDDLVSVLDGAPSASAGDALAAAMRVLSAQPCAVPDSDGWLWLACFGVRLSEAQDSVVTILDVDNTIRQRLVLMATHDVQAMMQAIVAGALASGAIGPGPRFTRFQFEGSGADSGTAVLHIALATDDTGAPIPLSAATFDTGVLEVQRLDPAAGWQDVSPDAGDTVEYRTNPEPRLHIEWADGLSAGNYQLSLPQSDAAPIVDERMQSLRPLTVTRQFTLVDVGGVLTMDSIY